MVNSHKTIQTHFNGSSVLLQNRPRGNDRNLLMIAIFALFFSFSFFSPMVDPINCPYFAVPFSVEIFSFNIIPRDN